MDAKNIVRDIFWKFSSAFQFCLFATTWATAHQASLSITNSRGLLRLISIELVMPSNHLILCSPFLLLPSVFLSIRVFSNESVFRFRWPRYWSFSFNISPSNEYSGLISFKIDWFDHLESKGLSRVFPTPQFKSINSLALSFLYGPTRTFVHDCWKNHSFDIDYFVGEVMSLLFNMLSRLVITLFQGASVF